MKKEKEYIKQERNKKLEIPIWFMVISGIFCAWQILFLSLNLTELKLFSYSFDLNINVAGYSLLATYIVALVLTFVLYKYNVILFKVSAILSVLSLMIMLLPLNQVREISFYCALVFSQFCMVPLITITIMQFSPLSAFKSAIYSLISGSLVYILYNLLKLPNLLTLIILGIVSGVAIIIGTFIIFENVCEINSTPRITRVHTEEEIKHNPNLQNKPRTIYPFKLTLGVILICLISTIIYCILKNKAINSVDEWIYYLGALVGAIIFGVVCKFKNKKAFNGAIYLLVGVLFLSSIFLFIDVQVLQIIGAFAFGLSFILLSFNALFAILIFYECPTKIVVFGVLVLEILANILSNKISSSFSSDIAFMATCLLLVGSLLIVYTLFEKYILQMFKTSLNDDFELTNNLSKYLNESEMLIFELMLLGYSKGQISNILYITKEGINTDIASILSKIYTSGFGKEYIKTFEQPRQ